MKLSKAKARLEARITNWERLRNKAANPAQWEAANKRPGSMKK